MKKVFFLFVLTVFTLAGCSKMCEYRFKMTNATQEKITLMNEYSEVELPPNEERIIFIGHDLSDIEAHDVYTEDEIINHGLWNEMMFETYVNDEKLDKELWRPEYWTYKRISKWLGEYSMTVTNKMIEKKQED